ncbi:hypothetical protein EVAR_64371_1 [Eumeta japonica]|uniref:Uncharacterized protein n=1 Tax=Eumeta variegata TaxID=151549 RepID=A0A4C1ZPC3_EUMVA|nr:hypothetical protein EVAR_64371_1 [Eumeta japonica]
MPLPRYTSSAGKPITDTVSVRRDVEPHGEFHMCDQSSLTEKAAHAERAARHRQHHGQERDARAARGRPAGAGGARLPREHVVGLGVRYGRRRAAHSGAPALTATNAASTVHSHAVATPPVIAANASFPLKTSPSAGQHLKNQSRQLHLTIFDLKMATLAVAHERLRNAENVIF